MNAIQLTALALLSSATTLSAFEGGYDYGNLLKNGGTFYSNSDNPYIQKAKFYGRAQYQFGSVINDGDNFNFTELRRTRLGLEVKFLDHFKWKGNADLDNGDVNDVSFDGFRGWDDAGLYADLKGLIGIDGLDKLSLFAGKTKVKIGESVHVTSTKIKTIERTRWTDSGLRPINSTGIILSGEKNEVAFELSVWANEVDDDFHFWKDSTASFAQASTRFGLGPGEFLIDGIVAFGEDPSDDYSYGNDYSWSVAYIMDIAGWRTAFNIGGAEAADFAGEGNLFGMSVLSYKEIYENLELVGRLSFATGDHFALDASSRYARDSDVVDNGNELNNASNPDGSREDGNAFNAYLGLNYYFHGDNSKVLVAVEYDQVNGTGAEDSDAVTFSAAYRLKF